MSYCAVHLKVEERQSAKDYPDRLASQHVLAMSYRSSELNMRAVREQFNNQGLIHCQLSRYVTELFPNRC